MITSQNHSVISFFTQNQNTTIQQFIKLNKGVAKNQDFSFLSSLSSFREDSCRLFSDLHYLLAQSCRISESGGSCKLSVFAIRRFNQQTALQYKCIPCLKTSTTTTTKLNIHLSLTLVHCAFLQYTQKAMANVPFHTLHPFP